MVTPKGDVQKKARTQINAGSDTSGPAKKSWGKDQ